MKCASCKQEIQFFIQKENQYLRNPCLIKNELCTTMAKAWKEYWEEKYNLAKIKEEALKYSKGIKK